MLTALYLILFILASALILAIFLRKEHYVKREIVINTPASKVFEYLRFLKNQDAFNKHAMAGSDRTREYRGVDGTAGFVYSWKGDKESGEGEKEIIKLINDRLIEMEIRFVKPMKTSATIIMEVDSLGNNETRVSWTNKGKLFYPVNLLIPFMEKSVSKGMDESLLNLKMILEQ